MQRFPRLGTGLKNTAWGEIPEYLESIAIQIEKDRGKTTDVFHIAIQVLVCAVIKEMKDFSVGDLDWDTLKKWGATLNYAEKFGFQVRVADNLLKKNLLAYFAAQNLFKSTAKK
ncbi:ribosome biogenesis protein RLP24-like [Gossypium australe]|uniref:Ribosome biogenesis protein RLP24-like n=1 Tax=Gossypium australe TaxID=47621 RepID=A0A5B6VSI5_9ROSI|nr:ribosome biogenesis protein RLP24-like [Gossypium australe]